LIGRTEKKKKKKKKKKKEKKKKKKKTEHRDAQPDRTIKTEYRMAWTSRSMGGRVKGKKQAERGSAISLVLEED